MSSSMASVCTGLAALGGVGVASALVSAAQQHRAEYLPGSGTAVDDRSPHPVRRPLRLGFAAVEVPVCVGDPAGLLVGSGRRTERWRGLRELVFDPLAARAARFGGRIHRGQSEPLTVLLHLRPDKDLGDPASQARHAYRLLDQLLREYPGLATRWRDGRVHLGPVTVLLTGAGWSGQGATAPGAAPWSGGHQAVEPDATELLAGEPDRLAFRDGTLADLGSSAPPSILPLLSEDWSWRFGWDGSEAMPPEERRLLRALVAQAHREGRGVRITGGPDGGPRVRTQYWRELVVAGVDVIGSDRRGALARFLRRTRRAARPESPRPAPAQLALPQPAPAAVP